jgi:tetratricopeptide (TPR) repeat protein
MQPDHTDTIANRQLAQALDLCNAGQFDQAKAIYARLMKVEPQRVEPYLNCGEIGMAEGLYEEALSWFERARHLRPDLPPALIGAGNALLALGRPDEALEVFKALQTLDPRAAMAARGTGEALRQLGRLPEARTALERAVALAPGVAGHHYALAQVNHFAEGDPHLAAMEQLAQKIAGLLPSAQCDLHFALAKAYDDLGRHRQAFEHLQKGNAIKHRYVAYDEAMFLGILRDLAAAFPAATMAARRGAGDPSDIPVFVVGMPRSGTTLVEQILASHPAVFGAGESMQLHRLLGEGLAGADFPARFTAVGDEALRLFGARYVDHMRAKAPSARRIIDKLPANFMLCGLIHCILPHARIIHVRRDPLDTCFSCFANLFSQNIDYSYDLGELGRYYRAYETLMAHWHRVLPKGTILDVSYEAVVADIESEARRLVAYAGLEWDPACLAFHRTRRVVHTMSATQVRQPLYQSAVGRAARYRPWLGPLCKALEI